MSIWMASSNTCRDFDDWKTVFDSKSAWRRDHGVTGQMVFRDGNDLMVLLEFPDVATRDAYLADPTLRQNMQDAGVIGVPETTGPWERVS